MSTPAWWEEPFQDLQATARESAGRRIAVVTLDLPDKRNAMSDPMTE